MLLFEAFLKFANIGAMLSLGLLILRSPQRDRTANIGLLLIVTFSAFLLSTGSESLRINGALRTALRLFDTLSIVAVWLLGLSLFDDDFRFSKRKLGFAALYVSLMIPVRLHYLGYATPWHFNLDLLVSGLSLLMLLHVAWQAVRGKKEDLIEPRRRIRVRFSICLVSVIASAILSERLAVAFSWRPDIGLYINYVAGLPLALWATAWLSRFHPEILQFRDKPRPSGAEHPVDPRDKARYQRLVDIIEHQQGYTEQGLTIGLLAERVGVPAHQLRNLINRTMGYSNFSGFVNYYRVKAVKTALADVEQARTPILTLAMNAGFSSLAPFNRAFKKEVGQTPTEYRAALLDKESSNTDQ